MKTNYIAIQDAESDHTYYINNDKVDKITDSYNEDSGLYTVVIHYTDGKTETYKLWENNYLYLEEQMIGNI